MTIGQPALNVPRVDAKTGQVDGRAMAQFCQNVALRIAAIEKALFLSPEQTLQAQLQGLVNQPDGLVTKVAGVLRTRSLEAGAGITITNPDGKTDAPEISLAATGAGFLVLTPDGLVTRVLVVASGTALTIADDDGQAGDPTFHGP